MASTGNLPEDALLEIWLRLPVKSLVRFRCISKYWFTFLKSPDFIDMHLKFSLARDDAYEKVLIPGYHREERKTKLSIHSNDKSLGVVTPNFDVQDFKADLDLEVLGSINGIICIYSSEEFLLCNPATSELRKIPPCPFGCPVGFRVRTDAMGFGFDSATNDYKIVRITYTDDDDRYNYADDIPHKTEIYNLSTDTWRELDIGLTTIRPCSDRENVLFNGSIHWFTGANEDNLPGILSFNISKEIFHHFHFPEAYTMIDWEENPEQQRLGVIHDSLAIIMYTNSYPDPHPYEQYIKIWMMKEYGVEESWTRQYSIGPFSGIERPISVWKNEQVLLECVYGEDCTRGDIGGYDVQLVACDLFNLKQLQKYDIYGFERYLNVTFYTETLVSIM